MAAVVVVTSEGGAGSLGARLERSRRFSGAPRGDCSWDGRREAALWASLADRAGSDSRRAWTWAWTWAWCQGRAPGLKLRRRSNSANIQQRHTCGGKEQTSKSQAQLRLNTSPCTKTRGYRVLVKDYNSVLCRRVDPSFPAAGCACSL